MEIKLILHHSFLADCLQIEALIEQIPDSSLTASSSWLNRTTHAPPRSRIGAVDDENGKGGWVPAMSDTNQWIQAEFFTVKTIFKVATKGRSDYPQRVTKYQLKYGLSGSEADFEYVTSAGGEVITFNANRDQDSIVENEFAMIFARVLRLCPVEWGYRIAVRWEVFGCY